MSHIWPGHHTLLRGMYRGILRGINKINPYTPVVAFPPTGKPILVQNELRKASKWPQQYGGLLRKELKFRIEEVFRKEYHRPNGRSILPQLAAGESLIELLSNILKNPTDTKLWEDVIKFVVELRQDELKRLQWKQQYVENKSKINQVVDKSLPSLTLRRLRTRRNRKVKKSVRFTNLSASQRRKYIKNEMAASNDNAGFVIRNYIKQLQLLGTLPNPYKLPYVPASLTRQTVNMPKQDALLPLSTSRRVLDAAYDSEYIDTILKPEVEYRINMAHHMDRIAKIVTERGPFPVKIKCTNAGAMPAYYMRLPKKGNRYVKQMAIDIQRLVRVARKSFIWNLGPGESATERKFGDGYGVRGSGGFSVDEIIYPRLYYEKLAVLEADWEILMEVEKIKLVHGDNIVTSTEFQTKLKKATAACISSWKLPLIISTVAIKNELQGYFDKYLMGGNNPMWEKRRLLQKRMNIRFNRIVSRYKRLLSHLKKDRVFMHSEIYRTVVVKDDYHRILVSQQKQDPEKRAGLPEAPAKGQGKKLGTYLREMGFTGYHMGNKFARRFKF